MATPIWCMPRRATCTVLLLTQLTACRTWSRMPGTVEQQTGAERIPQARLRLRNGTTIPLRDVMLSADSVTGYDGAVRERRAVPIADVASIDRRQLSVARTTALVVGTATAAILLMMGAAFNSVAKECC